MKAKRYVEPGDVEWPVDAPDPEHEPSHPGARDRKTREIVRDLLRRWRLWP